MPPQTEPIGLEVIQTGRVLSFHNQHELSTTEFVEAIGAARRRISRPGLRVRL